MIVPRSVRPVSARLVPVLVAAVLVAAACSDDGDTADSREPGADPPGAEEEEGSAGGSGSSTTLVPPAPTDPPEIPAPTAGDLEIPCGATEFAAPATSTDSPGVDSSSITIGTGNDRGGIASFNSGRGIIEAVTALAGHCNGLGGLLGREVLVKDYDAAVVETVDRVVEACGEAFVMVGHRFLRAEEAALTAGLCSIPLFPAGPLVREPFPLHGHLAAIAAAPAEGGVVVLVGPDTPAAASARTRRSAALAASPVPITVVGEVAYPVDRVADWSQVVAAAQVAGAGLVHLDGGCEHAVVPFLLAAASADWDPMVMVTESAYDRACLAADGLTDRLIVEVPFLPFEDGDAAPATADHAAILDTVGGPRTGDALLAASAFWRLVVSAAACGAALDRECVAEHAAGIDEWTGAGLHPPISRDATMEPCAVVLGVEDGAFVRRLPLEPGTYDCTPEWSVALAG